MFLIIIESLDKLDLDAILASLADDTKVCKRVKDTEDIVPFGNEEWSMWPLPLWRASSSNPPESQCRGIRLFFSFPIYNVVKLPTYTFRRTK